MIDPKTGDHWIRIQLGAEYHAGGHPILVKEPSPTVSELLQLASGSHDWSEVAASAWLLAETDTHGGYKERLLMIAEEASHEGDDRRAALLVGWGRLNDERNLRPTLGKTPAEVSADHNYFMSIAARARGLLRLKSSDALLRDPRIFD
ncbi:MAG TPA: hypothetical protein VLT17_01775 [Gemmatimonadales bacterium]|nr:hypothetical protein [Gemmatimonadales bacterium]